MREIVENFCEDIKIEMTLCDTEMRKAHEEIIRLQERLNLFSDRKTMLYGLLQTVGKIPVADVAPVVHGKWLNIDGDYNFAACSICGKDYEVATEEEAERGLWSAFLSAYCFCPNCGAKMDEDVTDT